jgi:hypothetical protein
LLCQPTNAGKSQYRDNENFEKGAHRATWLSCDRCSALRSMRRQRSLAATLSVMHGMAAFGNARGKAHDCHQTTKHPLFSVVPA